MRIQVVKLWALLCVAVICGSLWLSGCSNNPFAPTDDDFPVLTGFFYYSGGRQMPLKVKTLRVTFKYDKGFSEEQQDSLIASISRIVRQVDDSKLIDDFVACSLSTGIGYMAFLDSLDTLGEIYLVEPYFVTVSDTPMLVGESFIVQFAPDIAREHIDSINLIYNVVITDSTIGNTFLLNNTDSTGYRVLDLANVYYDLPETIFSLPNFSSTFVLF